MIFNIIAILSILFIALQIEKSNLKIPTPFTIIIFTLLLKLIYPDFMGFLTTAIFSEEMLIFIVILVLADAYAIKFKEVKENWISLVYLAGIGVVLSVLIGAYLTKQVLIDYNLSYGSLIALIAMCTATDPVSVITVLKKFKIPHKLKFLAEGESLFNDAAALIMFNSFGLAILLGITIDLDYGATIISKVILLSIIIGLFIGFFGTLFMKFINDLKSELLLILLTAYIAFELAEIIHASGLLAEIVAILTATTIIHKSFELEAKRVNKNKEILIENISNDKIRNKSKTSKYMNKFMTDITNLKRHKDIEDVLDILALIVNGVLFVSLANIINIDLLIKYKTEIFYIFLITIFSRMLILGKFMIFSNFTNKIPKISLKWFVILNLAGIKGGLSIVMLHMLSLTIPNFEYLELFNAIVSGVILLSIFIYIPLLILFISINKKSFEDEYNQEKLEKSIAI